jgi:rhodanese-related sulfurtransferase
MDDDEWWNGSDESLVVNAMEWIRLQMQVLSRPYKLCGYNRQLRCFGAMQDQICTSNSDGARWKDLYGQGSIHLILGTEQMHAMIEERCDRHDVRGLLRPCRETLFENFRGTRKLLNVNIITSFPLRMLVSVLLTAVNARLISDGFTQRGEGLERIRISRVAKLLSEEIPRGAPWRSIQVVDARSNLEYDGGHIRGAINCLHHDADVRRLYAKLYKPDTLFIFHCEFSHARGPTAAKTFKDVHAGSANSGKPLLVVVMDGGFSSFYPWFTELCEGKYWPEAKLGPGTTGNEEFLRLVRKSRQEL